jgi:1-acyl-sn-glycerol-3-phosphate acyltransferase
MQQLFARGAMYYAGVDVCWEGLELIDESKSYLTLYSHQSSLDAFILCTCPLPFRLIGKRSLYFIPFLGWLSFVWGNFAIDRRNLARAKATLAAALAELKTHHRSLLISPEGTRSKVGRPIDFKKGPFHTAMQARFPVMPVLVLGASELWHARQWGCVPGRVVMRVLPPVEVRDGDTHATLQSRVHRQFLAAYGQPHGPTRTIFHWMDVVIFPASLVALYGIRALLWG